MKAYFTTLDNKLRLHFKMKSEETKQILLKPIYVGLRICWKICEIMFEKCHKCKSAADKITTADHTQIQISK